MSVPVVNGQYRHLSLRNPNINYRSGWWSVSVQVAKNKSIFGAIVGENVALNALGRALAKKRPIVAVFPAGIPAESELGPAFAAAIREGWALAVSPQAAGSRLNKKIATWCNEFLLKNADEIWAGDISANGMLAQMLAGLGKSGNSLKGAVSSEPNKGQTK